MVYTVFIKHSLADPILAMFGWIGQEMCTYCSGDHIPNASIVPHLVVLKARSFDDAFIAQMFKDKLERVMKPHQLENGPRDKTKAMYKIPSTINSLWQSCERYIDEYLNSHSDSDDEVEYVPVNPTQDDPTYVSDEDDNISMSSDESEDDMSDFIVPDDDDL